MNKIVVPVDFGPRTDEVLDAAERLAEADHGEIHVVHVLTEAGLFVRRFDDSIDAWPNPRQIADTEVRLRALLEARRLEGRTAVLHGSVAEQIAEYARDAHADMILLADGMATDSHVTEELVHTAGCPVAAVRKAQPAQ
jgi:nucleotide-binding universal stress UspA family protein